jgi:ribonucleoside-diphosphate reductase alpha chain
MKAVEADGEWTTRAVTNGRDDARRTRRGLLRMMAESAWACGDPGIQYDTTINDWTPVQHGPDQRVESLLRVHVPDDSACNLASLNLMKFRREDGSFDVRGSSRRARDDHRAGDPRRPRELPDGIDRARTPTTTGRSVSATRTSARSSWRAACRTTATRDGHGRAITSLMHGEAYCQSARIAALRGPFAGYAKNDEPFLRVIAKHRRSVAVIPTRSPQELQDASLAIWDERSGSGRSTASATARSPCSRRRARSAS